MQKRRTRHGIQASPEAHSITGIHTASGLYSAYKVKIQQLLFIQRLLLLLEYDTSRTLHVRTSNICSVTCSNGQYCRTDAWVSCVSSACAVCAVPVRAAQRILEQQQIRTPCFLANLASYHFLSPFPPSPLSPSYRRI